MARHRVKLATVALALGLAALPDAAEAQFFGNWDGWDNGGTWDGLTRDGMAPQQVRRAIAERGFRVMSPLRRNGNVFVADVLDRQGHHERLIVAAADAQILQRFLVDDGGHQAGAIARREDADRDGLVPPADIPDTGRRYTRPVDRDVPPQRFGDVGTDDGSDDSGGAVLVTPPLRRASPPIRTVKPRLADRSPDVVAPESEPDTVRSTPLAPVAPRPVIAAPAPATPPVVTAPVAVAPAASPTVASPTVAAVPVAKAAPAPAVAVSRREPAPSVQPAPAVAPARRPVDPLAIPGSADGGAKPVRSVASGVTGTPVVSSPAAKAADVPVAPLD